MYLMIRLCNKNMGACLQRDPKILGYLKYLAESKVVFNTIEQIVAESSDPARTIPARAWLQLALRM